MRERLLEIYKKLPISNYFRGRIKEMLPYALRQPNPALRQYGTIQDLYPWRVDNGLDTKLYIQNYFSIFYPLLDTDTSVSIWCYDANGKLMMQQKKILRKMQTLPVSIKQWVKSQGFSDERGTLMWHIQMPETVSNRSECREDHAYFTDRGYIAFVKDEKQVSFIHGIDRYAVFQKTAEERFDLYYQPAKAWEWRPEIPLDPALQSKQIDIITVNRVSKQIEIKIDILDKDGLLCATLSQKVPHRGLFLQTIQEPLLLKLNGGSMRVSGLTTPWSRVAILRHCHNDSIAAMHC